MTNKQLIKLLESNWRLTRPRLRKESQTKSGEHIAQVAICAFNCHFCRFANDGRCVAPEWTGHSIAPDQLDAVQHTNPELFI